MKNNQYRIFHAAATLAQEAERSDPFVYGRAMCHMKNGLAAPSDFATYASRQLGAKKARDVAEADLNATA